MTSFWVARVTIPFWATMARSSTIRGAYPGADRSAHGGECQGRRRCDHRRRWARYSGGDERDDTIASGAGADIILGDQGLVTGSSDTVDGRVVSLLNEMPGDDVIDTGAGDDMVIAGLGNDSVITGEGRDLVLGDSGDLAFTKDAKIVSVVMTDKDRGGNDDITGDDSAGDKILLGQFGQDRIHGGLGDVSNSLMSGYCNLPLHLLPIG